MAYRYIYIIILNYKWEHNISLPFSNYPKIKVLNLFYNSGELCETESDHDGLKE